jgi:L-fuconolactonase
MGNKTRRWNMVIVDTHCHALPYWFEPVEVLLDQMTRNDVDKAVLTQIRGMYDNSYLIEATRRFPGRFSAVVIVDTDSPDAPEALERWVGEGAEGVRLDATTRSPGGDPLAIWRKADELGIPVSCPGSAQEFASPEFERVVQEFPNLKIIIEHLGDRGTARTDTSPPYPTYREVLRLSRYANTYMKVPGLGELCPRPMPLVYPFPFEGNIPPLIEMAIEAFDSSRLMWGSDFPPVASREGYRNALRFPMEHVRFRSDQDKEWVFGKTALSLWKFGQG